MSSAVSAGRAARAYLAAAVPFASGLLAGYLHATFVPVSWHGAPPEFPDLLLTGACAGVAATAAWSLATGSRMRLVLVLAAHAFGVAAGLFAFSLLVAAAIFRPPAPWHVPALVGLLAAAPVPAALAVRFTRRPRPKRRVDVVVLALGLVGLLALTVPVEYLRVSAMDADARHRAAVDAFGSPYLLARTTIASCGPFRDLAAPDPHLTISARRNTLEVRARETRGTFDFDFRRRDGGLGSVRTVVRTDPGDAASFVPLSQEEDGTYTVYVTPDGRRGRLLTCPPPPR